MKGPLENDLIDYIIGLHSIVEALKNPNRNFIELWTTREGKQKIEALAEISCATRVLSKQEFTKRCTYEWKKRNWETFRMGEFCLLAHPLPLATREQALQARKILCLDQITDMNNAAAILRTAAFYNVDLVVLPMKGGFSLTPNFFRTSSGSREHVNITSLSLSRFLKTLPEDFSILGLDEKGENEEVAKQNLGQKRCLVIGAEGKGISNAVRRQIMQFAKIDRGGSIHTLNASVAAALAMENFFRFPQDGA